ncbi:hypothetical protein [Mycoplasmopsis gallinarum]|uniref:hypothetical protein n=1 Tax=Mycoplasmopsis gallinarum TaxID=29557 RepID=UPI000481042C|nr:hypothetical protein [Mycoplasmopsis gallinarum]
MDIFSKFFEIQNSQYIWIAIVVLFLCLGLNFLWSFLKGWKGAIITNSYMIVSFIASVLIAMAFKKQIIQVFEQGIAENKNISNLNIEIAPLMSELVTIALWVVIFSINLLLMFAFWIIYMVVIKRFIKKSLKKSKKKLLNRFIGGLVGLVGIFPITVMSIECTSPLTYSNPFIKANSKVLNAISFGQTSGLTDSMPAFKGIDELFVSNSSQVMFFFDELQKKGNYQPANSTQSMEDYLRLLVSSNSNGKFTINYRPWKDYLIADQKEKYIHNYEFVNEKMQYFVETNKSFRILKILLQIGIKSAKEEIKNNISKFNDLFIRANIDLSRVNLQYENAPASANMPQLAFTSFNTKEITQIKNAIFKALDLENVSMPSDDNNNINNLSNDERIKYTFNKILDLVFVAK